MATTSEGTRLSADEALQQLIEGNQRFVRGEARPGQQGQGTEEQERGFHG